MVHSRLFKIAEQTDLKQIHCIPHSEGGKLETEEKKRKLSVEGDGKVKESQSVFKTTCHLIKVL